MFCRHVRLAQKISLSYSVSYGHSSTSHKLAKITELSKSTNIRVVRDKDKLKDQWENSPTFEALQRQGEKCCCLLITYVILLCNFSGLSTRHKFLQAYLRRRCPPFLQPINHYQLPTRMRRSTPCLNWRRSA